VLRVGARDNHKQAAMILGDGARYVTHEKGTIL
jgi:hypothetical protein